MNVSRSRFQLRFRTCSTYGTQSDGCATTLELLSSGRYIQFWLLRAQSLNIDFRNAHVIAECRTPIPLAGIRARTECAIGVRNGRLERKGAQCYYFTRTF